MSIAPSFGAGGSEPYARALQSEGSLLFLHDATPSHPTAATMDFARWNAAADQVDLTLLRAATGPLLDVGCGPGRMVRAALDLGMTALGVDISGAAVRVARECGLPVLERSIFDPLPREGQWQAVLLVDGNIGIGGDIPALLRRCAQLMSGDGEIVVETHPDPVRQRGFPARVVDALGHESAEFPWAEIGVERLAELAPSVDLEMRQSWVLDGRTFCRLVTATA